MDLVKMVKVAAVVVAQVLSVLLALHQSQRKPTTAATAVQALPHLFLAHL
jgi:hypothetical protein